MPDSIEYVERLYPEPNELGIAEADRAVAVGSVRDEELS